MIAHYGGEGGRRARVFARTSLDEDEVARLVADDLDDDDRLREPLLRDTLGQSIVEGTAHPGFDPPDVLQVFLTRPADPHRVFACTVVSEERLCRMLGEAPFVVEGFSLQVAAGSVITSDALRAALEAWSARSFPEVDVPRFTLLPWIDPPEVTTEALNDALRPVPAPDVKLPAQWKPDGGVAVPPFEEAA